MVNNVTLLGNLGKDPEFNVLESGSQYARFSLATSKSWTDKNSGEKRTETQWHTVIAWGKLAEICDKYLKKGSKVFIYGEIQYQQYETDGVKKYATNIVATEMKMLDRRSDSSPQPQEPLSQSTQDFNKELGEIEDDLPF